MSESKEQASKSRGSLEAEGLVASERDALLRLGAAVLDLWDRLPRERQQKLFAAATSDAGPLDVAGLRRKLAVILHGHHSRTGHVGRPGDVTHPPAGPHARAELTNFDATPGSGMLPPQRTREKEVDPGAG